MNTTGTLATLFYQVHTKNKHILAEQSGVVRVAVHYHMLSFTVRSYFSPCANAAYPQHIVDKRLNSQHVVGNTILHRV